MAALTTRRHAYSPRRSCAGPAKLLYQDCIDLDAKDEEQIKQLFAVKWEYVALTRKGVYSRLLRKRDGEELILRQLALPKEETT
jgi:hypothetical protein